MPVDSSMYLQAKGLGGIADGFQQGMQIQSQIREQKEANRQTDTNRAISNAYTKDPTTGAIAFDSTKIDPTSNVDMSKVAAAKQTADAAAAAHQEAIHKLNMAHAEEAAPVILSMNDPDSFQQGIQRLKASKNPLADEIGDQYDPQKIKAFQAQATPIAQHFAQQKEEAEMTDKGYQKDETGKYVPIPGGKAELGNKKTAAETAKDLADAAAKPQEVAAKIKENSIRDAERSDAHGNQQMQQVQSMLESARGNPEVAQAMKDRYAGTKLNSLLGDDPNKLSPSQVQLAASEVAKIATGGVPQSSELQHLTPHSIPGDLAKAAQYFTNAPSQANQGAFLKQYQDYANKLSADANNVVKDKYSRVIESRRGSLGKDNYETLKSQYLDPLNSPAKTAGGAPPAPKVGTVEDGHVFLGGDPASPKSWKAQ